MNLKLHATYRHIMLRFSDRDTLSSDISSLLTVFAAVTTWKLDIRFQKIAPVSMTPVSFESCHSVVSHSATLWTVAHQAPCPWGFLGKKHWSGLPLPSPGDLPHLGIKPASLTWRALACGFFTVTATWEALVSASTPISSNCNTSFDDLNLVKSMLSLT